MLRCERRRRGAGRAEGWEGRRRTPSGAAAVRGVFAVRDLPLCSADCAATLPTSCRYGRPAATSPSSCLPRRSCARRRPAQLCRCGAPGAGTAPGLPLSKEESAARRLPMPRGGRVRLHITPHFHLSPLVRAATHDAASPQVDLDCESEADIRCGDARARRGGGGTSRAAQGLGMSATW
jgi:hypothetical protein